MSARAATLLLVLLAVMPVRAETEAGHGEERSLLVHVTTPLDEDTVRTALVFRVIAAGLQKGRHVTVVFDADGVLSLKMGRWFGGHSTPIDRAAISERDGADLAELLGVSPGGIPDIYGSLLHFLKGRGLAVYVNQRALELRGIGSEGYDHAAEAVPEGRIIELLESTTAQISY